MARIGRRVWKSRGVGGRRVKKVAWGFSLVVNGKQEKSYREDWSKEDAEKALAARVLGIEAAAKSPAPAGPAAFGTVAARYLEVKRGRASWRDQKAALDRLLRHFGKDTPGRGPDLRGHRAVPGEAQGGAVAPPPRAGRAGAADVRGDGQPRARPAAPSAGAGRGVGPRREGAEDPAGAGARGPAAVPVGRGDRAAARRVRVVGAPRAARRGPARAEHRDAGRARCSA
jgi:hypothetical protein